MVQRRKEKEAQTSFLCLKSSRTFQMAQLVTSLGTRAQSPHCGRQTQLWAQSPHCGDRRDSSKLFSSFTRHRWVPTRRHTSAHACTHNTRTHTQSFRWAILGLLEGSVSAAPNFGNVLHQTSQKHGFYLSYFVVQPIGIFLFSRNDCNFRSLVKESTSTLFWYFMIFWSTSVLLNYVNFL